jgi:hypothetical protein
MIASIDTASTQFTQDLMEELCEEIREGNRHTLYGELIAESIEGAIYACFPLLRRAVGDTQIHSWVDDFLKQHHCAEPQFFHIVTEFVQFANTSLEQSQAQCSLMEYEWLLLATEIDDMSIPVSESGISAQALWQGVAYLKLNPSLVEIALPFNIDDIKVTGALGEYDGTHNYAVYRSSKHRVYSQSLSGFDRQLLASIRETQTISRDFFAQAIRNEAPDLFIERWLAHFCETDAIIFIKKK